MFIGIDSTLPFIQEGHTSTVPRKFRYDAHQKHELHNKKCGCLKVNFISFLSSVCATSSGVCVNNNCLSIFIICIYHYKWISIYDYFKIKKYIPHKVNKLKQIPAKKVYSVHQLGYVYRFRLAVPLTVVIWRIVFFALGALHPE